MATIQLRGPGLNNYFALKMVQDIGVEARERTCGPMRKAVDTVLDAKGKKGGLCNRQACLEPGATWFNHSTKAYYCPMCAAAINKANRAEAMELFGHELCTTDDTTPNAQVRG